ncbi:hypothetical protein LTR28_002420, partial [Elasticomyces elasticus]
LALEGFGDWNKRDFQQFINGSARYGRNNYEDVAFEVDSKDPKEIERYAKAFWKNNRYKEIANWEKHIAAIEDGELRLARVDHQRKMLRKKLSQYRVPLQQMKIIYSVSTTNKRVYTEEEDRFLLVMLDKFGVDSESIYERIRDEIRECPLFRFDWFFLSRTPVEISRRCTTLLTTITREMDPDGKLAPTKVADDEDEDMDEEELPAKKKARVSGVKNKQLDSVRSGGKNGSKTLSRSASVGSNGSTAPSGKGRGKGKGVRKA